jgi:hypothetical protein
MAQAPKFVTTFFELTPCSVARAAVSMQKKSAAGAPATLVQAACINGATLSGGNSH